MPYMVLFLVSTLLALLLRYFGEPLVVNLYVYHLDLCTSNKCMGIGAANRISFALAVFFGIHALLLRFVQSCSRLDAQSWWVKLTLFVALLVGAWLLPDSFYNVYMHISRVVSIGFLLLQLTILIDMAYQLNERWTADEVGMEKAVVAVSALLYAVSLTAFILLIIFFTKGDCKLETFFIAFTFVLTFLMTCLSVSPWLAEGGGLLPAGVITAYSYWLLFTALTSDPSSCNSISSRSREFGPLIIGLLLTAGSVTYATYSVASSGEVFDDRKPLASSEADSSAGRVQSGEEADEEKAVGLRSTGSDDADSPEDDDSDSPAAVEHARVSARFHLLLVAGSMYVCMLLSSWGSQTAAESGPSEDLNATNLWIKIATQWLGIALFTWTLIAPKVCPSRFGSDE